MAAIRFTVLKYLCSSANPYSRVQLCRPCGYYVSIGKHRYECDIRPLYTYMNRSYHAKESGFTNNGVKTGFGMLDMEFFARNDRSNGAKVSGKLLPLPSNRRVFGNLSMLAISPVLNYRFYSSVVEGEGDKASDVPEVSVVSSADEPAVSESGVGGSKWTDIVMDAWQSSVDAVVYTGERAKETSIELTPYVQQLLDAHPYLRNVIFPVGCTLAATIAAWAMMPRLLRRFHIYSTQSSTAVLSGITLRRPVPYEKSCWCALEDPVRCLITFIAFSHVSMMVAPTTIALHYVAPAWNGAVIVSFIWFLQRWKTNVFAQALAVRSIAASEQEKLLTLNRISSVSLFVMGLMALAEACGVAVNSVMMVGVIGGWICRRSSCANGTYNNILTKCREIPYRSSQFTVV